VTVENISLKRHVAADLVGHEDFRSKPYRDTQGYLTIGYGRNLDTRGITEPEGAILRDNDINTAMLELSRYAPSWTTHPESVQRALINMAFNLGTLGLMKFERMWHHLDRRQYDRAATEALDSLWARQVGHRASDVANWIRAGAGSY
jgi:lysozyme